MAILKSLNSLSLTIAEKKLDQTVDRSANIINSNAEIVLQSGKIALVRKKNPVTINPKLRIKISQGPKLRPMLTSLTTGDTNDNNG